MKGRGYLKLGLSSVLYTKQNLFENIKLRLKRRKNVLNCFRVELFMILYLYKNTE